MINGGHVVLYSKDADADRNFLKDVLGLPHVDGGHGWLIFALPPSEIAVHPSEKNDVHEFFLMCDDIDATLADLVQKNVAFTPVETVGWGKLTRISLPGGGRLALYQPRHARP